MIKIKTNQNGFAHIQLILTAIVLLFVMGVGGWRVSQSRASKSKLAEASKASQAEKISNLTSKEEALQPQPSPITDTPAAPATAPTATKKSSPALVTQPAPPPPAPPISNNCLPPNANQYQSTWSSKTTSQVLQSNGYTSTQKFYDALQFAGLLGTINNNKTVVFAVNDYVFDNDLTQAQKDYLYASPENMKAMLKWQIVPSCVIWSGQIEKSTGPVSFQTLGGTVTHYVGSPGNIDGAKLAMWDFFSSNGAMHLMSDFIRPPVLP